MMRRRPLKPGTKPMKQGGFARSARIEDREVTKMATTAAREKKHKCAVRSCRAEFVRPALLAFCNSWLAKEQDRASTRLPATGPGRPQPFDPVAHVNQGGQPPLNGGAGAIIDINPR